jgi:hypothetical protein
MMMAVVMMPRTVDMAMMVYGMAIPKAVAMATVGVRPTIAVHDRAGHRRTVIIVVHGVGVTTAVVGVVIRTAVGVPSGNGSFLIGRHRSEVARATEGRSLIDIIILRWRRQTFVGGDAVARAVIAWIIALRTWAARRTSSARE